MSDDNLVEGRLSNRRRTAGETEGHRGEPAHGGACGAGLAGGAAAEPPGDGALRDPARSVSHVAPRPHRRAEAP